MTKERLKRYQAIKTEAQELRKQLEEIEAGLYYPKIQQRSGMPSNPSPGNAAEDLAIKHLEKMDMYHAKLAELDAELLAVEQAIDGLEPQARTLMRAKYIRGQTWEQVCITINFSWSQTHRLHKQALRQLREKEKETQANA